MNIGNYIFCSKFFQVDFHTTKNSSSHEPQNFSQKTKPHSKIKEKNPIIIWLFWFFGYLYLFFKNCSSPQPNICVFFFHLFLEIFRQTKNFMKERSSSENWKKKRRRKLKEKKKKKLYQSVYWCHSMQWIQFLETHLCINNRKKQFFFRCFGLSY